MKNLINLNECNFTNVILRDFKCICLISVLYNQYIIESNINSRNYYSTFWLFLNLYVYEIISKYLKKKSL